jgi:hypothetical protein
MFLNAYYKEGCVVPIITKGSNTLYNRAIYYRACDWCEKYMKTGTWRGESRSDNTQGYYFAIIFQSKEDALFFKLSTGS